MTQPTHILRRAVLLLLALSTLAAVFTAYLDPELALDLATRVWSCL